MLNFDFLEKGLGIVSSPHLAYEFSANVFLMLYSIKVGLSPSKKICFNDSPSKMMKNAFYFILKALFVLKIFRFLSWPFGHVGKTTWLER